MKIKITTTAKYRITKNNTLHYITLHYITLQSVQSEKENFDHLSGKCEKLHGFITEHSTQNSRLSVQDSTINSSTARHGTARHGTGTGTYSTVQYSTVQYSTVQYSTVQYSTVQYSTVQYSTVQYSTVQYSTVQYSTVQYSTVQYSTVFSVCIPVVEFRGHSRQWPSRKQKALNQCWFDARPLSSTRAQHQTSIGLAHRA